MTDAPARRARPVVPDSLARRPWDDKRNVPIPVFAEHERNGETVVDFTALHWDGVADCARRKVCAMCDEPLDYYIAFLGGPLSAGSHCYVNGPFHESCVEASFSLCPHIAIPHAGRASDSRLAPGIAAPPGMSLAKPEQWVVGVTRNYRIVENSPHGPHLKAGTWVRTRTFRYEGFTLVEQALDAG